MNTKVLVIAAATAVATAMSGLSSAQSTFTENFTGATTTNSWYFYDGACLTAGSTTNPTSPGQVPSCTSIGTSYYKAAEDGDVALVGGANGVAGFTQTLPDPVGSGAVTLFDLRHQFGLDEVEEAISAATGRHGFFARRILGV